ncbi:MAG: hypothetical protein PHW03_10005, partial [Eubacteriales bacterium]|nr:hypothetical protein [Eubacteriales bacterium]
MNEQEKAYNSAAINRIEGKLDELLTRRKATGILAVMAIVTLLMCTAINVYAERVIQTMQTDALDQIMELRQ